jgi:beta-glucosidase
MAALLSACGGSNDSTTELSTTRDPRGPRQERYHVDGKQFKDLNANGKLDKYEDWRLSVDERINDLVSQMTAEEKVGMMMINDNNAGCAGAVTATADGLHQHPEDDAFHPALHRSGHWRVPATAA